MAVLALIVGGLLVLSLSTIVAGTEKAPARYAQIPLGSHGLDVWRDSSTGDLTFHWTDDNASEASRYSPKRSTLAEMSDGQILSVQHYRSSAAAWTTIRALYGLSQRQVHAALVAGAPSPLPPTAGDRIPKAGHETSSDYGHDIAALAKATGLTLPRLRSLQGFPLVDAAAGHAYGPVEGGNSGDVAVLAFGNDRAGNTPVTVNVAAAVAGNPHADGSVDKQMYASSRWPHHQGPVRYEQSDEFDILFPYRQEWVGVTTNRAQSRRAWASIIRAILAAPTT